jgi:uncharacterized membrane protein
MDARARGWALALMLNAFTWGVSWWPLRQLEAAGLHPLWATVLIYALAVVLIIVALRARRLGQLLRTPVLWVLVLAAGTTNATFNWAVTIGDVVRVVLLFYLMPLWAVLLARLLLGERLTPRRCSAWRWRWPAPRSCCGPKTAACRCRAALPDWLGVIGGFSFALNNVMLRREAHQPEAARALAMFLGGQRGGRRCWRWPVGAGAGAAAAGRAGLAGRRAGAGAVFPGRQPGPAVRRRAAAGQRDGGGDAHRGAVRQVSAVLLGAGVVTPALVLGGRSDRAGLAAGGAPLTCGAFHPPPRPPWPNPRSTTSRPCPSTASRPTCRAARQGAADRQHRQRLRLHAAVRRAGEAVGRTTATAAWWSSASRATSSAARTRAATTRSPASAS